MTPAEVIEEIKRLPREGQREVRDFVEKLQIDSTPVSYIPREEFRRATNEVLEEYHELFKKLAQ